MKKTVRNFMAACLALSAVAACEKENKVQTPQQPEGPVYIIKASMGDDLTKTVIADGESMKWAKGDVVKLAAKEGNSSEFTVSEDGLTELTLTATGLTEGTDFVLMKILGTQDFANSEIKFFSNQEQAKAGVLSSDQILLHSPVTSVPTLEEGQTEITIPVKMNIIGSLYRFIPYTAKYNDESIKNVKFESATELLAGSTGGLIGKNYNEPDKYKVEPSGALSETCKIFWNGNSKSITTTLNEPFSLDGVSSKETSHGIYMSVPPVHVGAYTCMVETDKAIYTFNALDKDLTVAENKLVNFPLNLDKAERMDLSEKPKDVIANGGGLEGTPSFSFEVQGEVDRNIGYALFTLNGVETRDEAIYNLSTFVCVSEENYNTGNYTNTETWLRCSRKPGDLPTWLVTVDENNTDVTRVAYIVCVFPEESDDYIFPEKPKAVRIVQLSKNDKSQIGIGTNGLTENIVLDAEEKTTDVGYCVLTVNGTQNNPVYDDVTKFEYYADESMTESVDWLSCDVKRNDQGGITDCRWLVSAKANTTGVERVAYIVLKYVENDKYEYKGSNPIVVKKVTQKAE